ncbi:DUF3097 domain-containing protein [Cryobacterium sp. PH31-AA6]|uniref:DUF3097 domain-containing protein n=1 Tax=Cryobacterium sp. PH31-AA6 TaxID=3046205 RepID=UPI0024B8D632|nr:DUF3097 domain-containing protein [Cryobacterium sp. PH31-AA6]MDJ0322723.1 DUF3097 domain-containing protein [Cryobacterium sp. PH31-AA6]
MHDRNPQDRYSADVLKPGWRDVGRTAIPTQEATADLVVEEVATGFCGAVVRIEKSIVTLEDRHGKLRLFPLGGGFLIDGRPVVLVAPTRTAPRKPARTASGSVAVADAPARVARGSRIFVEGRHDAELVEKVWGADLRIEGVVVEYIEGVDNLEELLAVFKPGPTRKIGMLVDHLVAGSKESRIADAVGRGPYGQHVLVVGHPYVDVWQAVKPARLGLTAWPAVPRSIEWKHGICAALGWPHDDQADIARAWQRILGRVRTFADLEPQFLGRVEHLIDFVTVE